MYINRKAQERIYFVNEVKVESDVLSKIHESDLSKIALIEEGQSKSVAKGTIHNVNYKANRVEFSTKNSGDGFVVLADTYYPTWKVKIDGVEAKIYRTNYSFRGVFVPKGEHAIQFINTIF